MSEFVRVATGGSPREMGVDMGRAVTGQLESMLAETVRFHERASGLTAIELYRTAQKRFLKTCLREFPGYMEEVRGIAEGAGLTFDELFFLTVDEELSAWWKSQKHDHCSSVAIRRGGKWLVAHNEDFPPRYFGRLAIIDAQPDDAPAFLALTYPYMLAGTSCGMNDAGLAFTANSLRFPAKISGVPTNFILRDMYGARTLDEAERRIARKDALMCNAAIVASVREDDARAIELSPNGMVLLHPDTSGMVAQTNHMLGGDSQMREGERPTRSSKKRFEALEAQTPNVRTRAGLERLFSSSTKGLLVRPSGPGESCTIATAVVDVNGRAMYVAKRGSDGHGFKKYRMRRRSVA